MSEPIQVTPSVWTWPPWSEPGMRLPEGKTCSDCARFRKCNDFLGGDIANNRVCDWAPSYFVPVGLGE
jgi:hypothetical protein